MVSGSTIQLVTITIFQNAQGLIRIEDKSSLYIPNNSIQGTSTTISICIKNLDVTIVYFCFKLSHALPFWSLPGHTVAPISSLQ